MTACHTARVTLASPRLRTGLFVGAALAINVIDALAVRAAAGSPRAAWVGAGAVVDLVGVVTLLYWGLLVRPGLRGRASMAVVAALSAVRAALLLPTPPPVRLAIVGLLEGGVVGALGWTVWSARGRVRAGGTDTDVVDTLRAAATRIIPVPAIAELVTFELAVMAYAVGLAGPARAMSGVECFPMVKRSGFAGLIGVITFAGLVEIAIAHLLLSRWQPAAWLATAVGVYGLVYLRGLTRAIDARPILVDDARIVVRQGLTFHLDVPVEAIRAAEPVAARVAADVTLPRRRTPAWLLTLDTPLEARRLFGRRQMVRTLALTVDDDAAFGRAIAGVIARRTARTSS
jgi:hypothetical protein